MSLSIYMQPAPPFAEMHTTLGAGRPSTACKHCRAQKVRCSGDAPSCKRCLRLHRHCVYQDIPAFRANAGLSRNAPHQQIESSQVKESRHSPPLPDNHDIRSSGTKLGIPSQLVLGLVDTFFMHAYNAHLLFHKETFLQDQAVGKIRQHVLLSLCAFAAIFHLDSNGHNSLNQHGFATEWAERAGRLVLSEVETPNEDNIVSFLILALFWYSRGNWRRSHIHKGNAMQTAHILKLANKTDNGISPLKAEVSRRRFWACYLLNCHTSESIFAIDPPRVIANVPLPWSETDFSAGASVQSLELMDSTPSGTSIYAELVRALSFWSATYNLIKSPDMTSETCLNELYHLDTKLSKWWSNLPEIFHLTSSSLPQAHHQDLPKLVLIQVLYLQSLCALHSSIVPLYSWGEERKLPGLALQLSAQIAFDNACAVSELFRNLLERSKDTSNFTSFLGYAAYCGCAIQIPFMWCSNISVKEKATKNVQVNLQIIRSIGQNWKFVSLLGNYAEYIMKMHANNPLYLDNEPKGLLPDKLNGFRVVASQARASILGHNAVLWKEDGISVQGDEVMDLGFGSEQPVLGHGPRRHLLADVGCNVETVLHHASHEPLGSRVSGQPALNLRDADISTQEDFFQPLLGASDLFELLPDCDFPTGNIIVNNEWELPSMDH
ncbi:hypothetical protein BGZ63DRAFT_396209 [Mariannaea sp. PMI_226]|nr:hypothetical protein BGZ63DRAFT_396209 [Mariannaea sp. PMI_226]